MVLDVFVCLWTVFSHLGKTSGKVSSWTKHRAAALVLVAALTLAMTLALTLPVFAAVEASFKNTEANNPKK